ncbi:NAD(P)-dependent alcohol dehydrogenase [Demequina lignilytica]|uniref:NAD(P)-dependent alcohol dehydrogenase n=1 Tax=Demequina lignilytica TaxID=3051663 RepID=A0AB35MG47_9MICO|nr:MULTISPECIES: NAD(P)-dependent alcohol dehydrogenase [unclassified Demequina]MDN4482759.1 NAD(P)-dependent alcohol dehydrogenase [Demequina sp. SYSU T0a273]MDN4490065.1 NAD(P)-dependent alcohol dehydrogenase [Demequina sp. SYSU T00068]
MKAVRFDAWKTRPTLVDVERPVPGPGEVLLKVAGSGACHSDVALYAIFEEAIAMPQLRPAYVLGHEVTGWVEEAGPGVVGMEKGDAYMVYAARGCGHCSSCSRGEDTLCVNVASMTHLGSGLGLDGGMAEYMTVPVRNLVPLEGADPIAAAPLVDAGLTAYHAVKLALPKLAAGGRTALVIGLGGVGQLAVQLLREMSAATVLATDLKPEARDLASRRGAVIVDGGEDQAARIRELTGGRGVDAVFDLVGTAETMQLAQAVVAVRGRITVVGLAGGRTDWGFYTTPFEAEIMGTYMGTLEELHELSALYRAGRLEVDVTPYPLEDALEAYGRLEAGTMLGRAVVVPHPDAAGVAVEGASQAEPATV